MQYDLHGRLHLSIGFGNLMKIIINLSNNVRLENWSLFLSQYLERIDIGIFPLLIGAVVSALNLFLYCYFGKLATESHAKIADCLYKTNWQNLPIDSQKYFILMIANMQKPLHYHGFKIAVLDLETFTNVRNLQSCQKLLGSCFVFLLWSFNFSRFLKTVFTYYMMFKTLTEWAKTEVGYK